MVWSEITYPDPTGPLFGPNVDILFKLNYSVYDGSSVVLRMISDDFQTRFGLGSD